MRPPLSRASVAEVALFTARLEETLAFYRKLLGVEPLEYSGGHAVFALGRVRLLIHAGEMTGRSVGQAQRDDWPPDEDHVAFAVTDLEGCCARMRRSGRHVVGPKLYPWGVACYLHDPDGRLVEVVEEVEET